MHGDHGSPAGGRADRAGGQGARQPRARRGRSGAGRARAHRRPPAGREVALALPTGSVLEPGAILRWRRTGTWRWRPRPEAVLAASRRAATEALRMAFDVGNRHFTLAVEDGALLVPDDPAMAHSCHVWASRCERRETCTRRSAEAAMTDPRLLSLLHFADSALPTGGYAHSFGLERYCQAGVVRDRHGLERFLLAQLEGARRTVATPPRPRLPCARSPGGDVAACHRAGRGARGHEGRAGVPRGQPADGAADPAGRRDAAPGTPPRRLPRGGRGAPGARPSRGRVRHDRGRPRLGGGRGRDRAALLDDRAAGRRGAPAPAHRAARGPVGALEPAPGASSGWPARPPARAARRHLELHPGQDIQGMLHERMDARLFRS